MSLIAELQRRKVESSHSIISSEGIDNPGSTPIEWPMMLPALDPIRCTPRFRALVQKLKTHDPRAATVCATGTR